MALSLGFHIIGLVFWMSGIIMLPRFLAVAAKSGQIASVQPVVERLWYGFALPGSLLVVISGLYQVFSRGASFYMKQGWFHFKITAFLVLIFLTIVLHMEQRKIAAGGEVRPGRLHMLHGIAALLFVLIVFVTMLYRL